MITFKAKALSHAEYTSTLLGSDGEEQLVIVASWGQDFACSLVIVATQCDSRTRVLFDGKSKRFGPVATLMKVKQVVDTWSRDGDVNADYPAEAKRAKQTRKLLVALAEHWKIGDELQAESDKVVLQRAAKPKRKVKE